MKFLFTPTAEEHSNISPHQIKKRIASKMRFYEDRPDPLQFAELLTGSLRSRAITDAYATAVLSRELYSPAA